MIAILGGGISGLSAAWQLKKAGKEFVLLEASAQLGGKIKTIKKDGFLIETGPNTVLVNNTETKQLLEDLNLWEQLIFPKEEAVKNRFVLKNNSIEAIPTSVSAAIKSKLFSFSTLFSVLKEPFVSSQKSSAEESLANFSQRRFGKQIFEDFITPFVTGIYAGDPEKMSINYTLAILKEAEEKHGSILRGMPKIMKAKKAANKENPLPKQKIFSFKNGLSDLIFAIEREIKPSTYINSVVKEVHKNDNKYTIAYQQNGKNETIIVDTIICCLPANITATICKPLSHQFANALKKINYVPAVSISFAVDKNMIDFKKEAFGILSRKAEQVPFLGILFNSRFFPHTSPKGKELLTVIGGGARYPALIEKTDNEIIKEMKTCISALLGIHNEIKTLELVRWKKGIPQYELGYAEIENEIESFLSRHQNFYLAANYYKGVSVSDCIKNGASVAQKII